MARLKHIRSLLFTSVMNVESLKQLKRYDADVYILDLEDAVREEDKDIAREKMIALLSKRSNCYTAIRLNPIETLEGIKDLEAILENNLDINIIVPAKVRTKEEIIYLRHVLKHYKKDFKLFPLIETADAINHIFEIAEAIPEDGALVFGSADLSAELGCEITWENFLTVRSEIILAASLKNLRAIDAPFFTLGSSESELLEECQRAKSLGFTGKLAVHPNQIETINDAFTLSAEEIKKYNAIINAVKDSRINIAKLSTEMIGPPFLKYAKKKLKDLKSPSKKSKKVERKK